MIKTLILIFLFSLSAFAAQDATIIIDNAIVRTDPKDSSAVVEYLPVGSEVRISSQPFQGGWYKVRARTGQYGWIHEAYLSVTKISQARREAEKKGIDTTRRKVYPKPEADRLYFVRGTYGIQFQNPVDISEIFSFSDELNQMNYAGLEAGYFFTNNFAGLFRFDYLSKDLVTKEKVTGLTYNLGLRSYPVMAGAEFYFMKAPPLRISLAAYVGMAMSTAFSVQSLTTEGNNTVTLSDNPLTTLIRFNVTRPLGRLLSISVEGGYRFLVSKELTTDAARSVGRAGEIFIQNNRYKNRIIDYSGFDIGASLGVHF